MHHYIKNLLIFIPLICSGQLFTSGALRNVIFAFLSFCFTSSAVYFINDINDIKNDRNHPVKCKRPIAAGMISKRAAVIFTIVLISAAILFEALCFKLSASLLLLLYFVLNILYSSGLKNIPLLDVTILVSGFLIRTVFGSMVTGISISNWLYLVVISTSFYFGFGKRKNELLRQKDNNTRSVIKNYPLSFLEKNMYVCMALDFIFYALWTVDKNTVALYQNSKLIWTVPIVMIIFMKYSLTIEGNSDGDPVEVLLHDKVLIALTVGYLMLMFGLLYFVH